MAKTKTKKKSEQPEEGTIAVETVTTPDEHVHAILEEAHKEEFKPENMRQSGNIKILKAKITKHQALEVDYRETYEDGTHSDVNKKCESLIHKDLTASFDKLVPHFIMLCDQKGADELLSAGLETPQDFQLLEYNVNAFSIGGDDEQEGITLIGNKDIEGKILNLVSPFTKWEEDYKYISELGQAMQSCIHEVKEYLGGKCAVKQTEIPFE